MGVCTPQYQREYLQAPHIYTYTIHTNNKIKVTKKLTRGWRNHSSTAEKTHIFKQLNQSEIVKSLCFSLPFSLPTTPFQFSCHRPRSIFPSVIIWYIHTYIYAYVCVCMGDLDWLIKVLIFSGVAEESWYGMFWVRLKAPIFAWTNLFLWISWTSYHGEKFVGLEACAVDGRDGVKKQALFLGFFLKFVVVVWFILGGFCFFPFFFFFFFLILVQENIAVSFQQSVVVISCFPRSRFSIISHLNQKHVFLEFLSSLKG